MLNLIYKMSTELGRSSSKIFQVFSFCNKYLAIVVDAYLIEIVDYNRKEAKVNDLVFAAAALKLLAIITDILTYRA